MIWLQANQSSFKNVRNRDFSPDCVRIASRSEDFSPLYKTKLQGCDTVGFKLLSFSAVIDNYIKMDLDCLCDRPQALQWEACYYKSIRHNSSMHST